MLGYVLYFTIPFLQMFHEKIEKEQMHLLFQTLHSFPVKYFIPPAGSLQFWEWLFCIPPQ